MKKKVELHELFSELDDMEQIDVKGASAEAIKKRTLTKIAQLKEKESELPKTHFRIRRKFLVTGIAAALSVLFAIGICAASERLWGVQLFNKEARSKLKQPQYVVISSTSQPQSEKASERTLTGYSKTILDIDYLEENDVLFFDDVGTVSGTKDESAVKFPEFVFNNGETAILTNEDGSGWQMEKNDTITISLRQNLKDNPHAFPEGNKLALGIIVDGIPNELRCDNEPNMEYTYTAEKSAEVYFYVQDFSSEPIIVSDAMVTCQ